jgi:peptide/nickel transport system substrate-binding protein
VKFSDGESVDADAVVKSLEVPQGGRALRRGVHQRLGITAKDDHTVEVTLTQRDDTILYLMGLGRSYIMSPKSIAAGTSARSRSDPAPTCSTARRASRAASTTSPR